MPYRAQAERDHECVRVAEDYSLRPTILIKPAVYLFVLAAIAEFSWVSILLLVIALVFYLMRDVEDRRLVRSVCVCKEGRFYVTTWFDHRKSLGECLHEIDREKLSLRRRRLLVRFDGYRQLLFLTDEGRRLLGTQVDVETSAK